MELDLQLRHVDTLTVEPMPVYTELDLRLGWSLWPGPATLITDRNLLASEHV